MQAQEKFVSQKLLPNSTTPPQRLDGLLLDYKGHNWS